jgi:hypothetical protein
MKLQNTNDWIVAYLIPRSLWIFGNRLRHPIQTYYSIKKNRWCRTRKVGDLVCNCSGNHVTITEIGDPDDPDDIITSDGTGCSLYHCCSPVMEDNSCHGVMTDILKWYKDNNKAIPKSLLEYFGYGDFTFGNDVNTDA